ncbi:universal stress protein [Segetibacter aerophilus]|uniref:UspA domain-containing protein n=1 Tax=Segetibacter aerophilus TaxID=670293 RepID=A0A512BK17_9BACT|nr:universal stress protein [Segetibacter aerophilus]GEO12167.1 hypothetical protein SAE01_46630 [Segetibacter aerophilus]
METILIATDFSTAARNATIYGFELARKMKAKVILFTACHHKTANHDNPYYLSPSEIERTAYKKLLDEAEILDPKRTVVLETQVGEGAADEAILAAASKSSVSYIIIGMKEQGKEIRKYIGSTVTHLSKTSVIPLIVVPADAVFTYPKTIALANDISDETDIDVLEPLKKITSTFNCKLYVVRVMKKTMIEVAERVISMERLKSFFASFYPYFEFIKAENVVKALNAFVKSKDVNMVAVIPHEHSFLERVFTRSVTRDLVFKAVVPLLILPEKHYMVEEDLYQEKHNFEYYCTV